MSTIESHQASLRFLVILQVVTAILSVVAFIVFPEPEEITSALAVMEELEDSTSTGWYAFMAVLIILGMLVLWARSLWQLYHLNEKGFVNFLAYTGLSVALLFAFGGGWQTGMVSVFDEIRAISAGAIIYIGIFYSDAFEGVAKELQSAADTGKISGEEVKGQLS